MNHRESPTAVIDTDVASFLFSRDPVRVQRYAPHLQGRLAVLPFATVGELLFGARHRNWGFRRLMDLEQFIRSYEIEYPNYVVCEIWSDVRATARKAGKTIEPQDAWVAATAIYLDLPLVTHNASDYAGVSGIQIITEPDKAQ